MAKGIDAMTGSAVGACSRPTGSRRRAATAIVAALAACELAAGAAWAAEPHPISVVPLPAPEAAPEAAPPEPAPEAVPMPPLPVHADATRNLFEAALGGTASEVKAALSAGADPGARGEAGSTPLHWAAHSNSNPSVIAALIEAGADPGARTEGSATPLHTAATHNSNPSMIAALIESGADADARTEYGVTPLHRAAAFNDNPSVIAALIESGADPGARTEYGALFLQDLDTSLPPFAELILIALIEADAARGEDGAMPLHWAAMFNANPSVITALIKAGADPDARGEDGMTPLHWAAAENSNPSVIKALIEGGADPGARDDAGMAPFDYAKENAALQGTDAYWLLNEARFE